MKSAGGKNMPMGAGHDARKESEAMHLPAPLAGSTFAFVDDSRRTANRHSIAFLTMDCVKLHSYVKRLRLITMANA